MAWKRWLIAISVFCIVFAASLGVAGSQAAADAPEDSPAWFQTAPSRIGDQALYKTALVIVKDGSGEYVDMDAQYAFERLPDEVMLQDGQPTVASSFVAEWRTEYYEMDLREVLGLPDQLPEMPELQMPDCMPTPPGPGASEDDWEDYEDAVEDCAQEMEDATEGYADDVDDWAEDLEAWMEVLDAEEHIVIASDWHVTHHAENDTVATTFAETASMIASIEFKPSLVGDDSQSVTLPPLTFTEPVPVPGPCGWRTSLQDGPQDMWAPITVHGECPPDMDLGFATVRHVDGPMQMEVSGEDTVNGTRALVFSMPGAPDDLRLWFQEDTPYPVRVLTRTTSVPAQVQMALGTGYDAPAFYVLHEMVRFEPGADTEPLHAAPVPTDTVDAPWGPVLDGHPWPLAEAVTETSADTVDCGEWASWVEERDARAVTADYDILVTDDPDHAEPVVDEVWRLRAKGGDSVLVQLHRHTETTADLPTGSVRVPDVWCSDPVPVQADAPAAWLSTASGQARLDALGGSASDYGFQEERLTLERGPLSPDQGAVLERLHLAPDGGLLQWARSSTPYPEPTFGDPAWEPDADDDWAITPAGKGVWTMPEPATAATLTGVAVGSGLLVLVALKALAALPLFSRIKAEDLLEHPVRGDIMEAIQADPGIHFQELVRRIGKGRGTMEHHVRKLVAGGLLVERASKGFSCYFPKGKVDRHLMAAAPLLKGGGKKVLSAVCSQPGSAALQVADHLGMSTSTVNYHVKRLAEAGLLHTQREGRYVLLRATNLGDEALQRFGQT